MVIAAKRSVKHIHSKVVGVSRRNTDGSDRQWLIQNVCRDGMRLNLVPEPTNKHDPNAIRVELMLGGQLGYISRELAAEILPMIGGNHQVGCVITQVTQAFDDAFCGVNIAILIGEAGSTEADLHDYASNVLLPEVKADIKRRIAATDDGDEIYDL
jgi:hypothetical protein